jgi:quinol monooxygenase YgiN
VYFDTAMALSVPHTNDPAAFGASTPFILIARVQVKQGKVKEYLDIADETDKGVQDSEPGMLHHTFDVSEDDDHAFTWSEVYQNDAALEAHLANPVVGTYLQKHAEVCESFSVEIYGTLSAQTAKAAKALPFPVKIWKTALGYSRVK